MKDRIRQIMESLHMSQQVFADFIGTNPATLSGIFNNRNRPTLNVVEAIKKKIPDISTDWLMFGTGSMYASEAEFADGGEAAHGGSVVASAIQNSAQEGRLDFERPSSTPNSGGSVAPSYNSVRNTRLEMVREDLKHLDKPQRRVTEIRVYYDDQTWESFVPSKK